MNGFEQWTLLAQRQVDHREERDDRVQTGRREIELRDIGTCERRSGGEAFRSCDLNGGEIDSGDVELTR